MAGQSKSLSKKNIEERAKKAAVEELAVQLYRDELAKPKKERKGARTICDEATHRYFVETGEIISVNYNTIRRQAKGGRSIRESNEERGHLMAEEVDKVIEFAEELADRNIPLTRTTLKQYVELIIKAREPEFEGLGKNWTDRFLEKQTRGQTRYIFLDGHLSRIHLPFLNYCRENNIQALCYPSHSTHIYQGLDVIVFSPLKRYFSDEMLNFEAMSGMAVNKSNFLTVYTPAHLWAFTKENIKLAFEATGLYPFNPNAIPKEKLKPSIETSTHGDGLPLEPPTPVRIVASLIKGTQNQSMAIQGVNAAHENDDIDPQLLSESTKTIAELQSGTAAFLISPSPIKATSVVPIHIFSLTSIPAIPSQLLSSPPTTELEALLQKYLAEAAQRETNQQRMIVSLQASMVLQSVYCEKVRNQLFAKENAKKKGKGRLLGDGLPRCLTGDDFFARITEFAVQQAQEEAEKLQRRDKRSTYSALLAEWKRLEGLRNEKEKEKTRQFADEMKEWQEECCVAKEEKRKPCWNRPKRQPWQPAIPKPSKPWLVNNELEEIDINVSDCSNDEDSESLC